MTYALYMHVPFCSYLCHYCDFAKTANYGAAHVASYFESLDRELARWLKALARVEGQDLQLGSVFFGGGTPSLFVEEYEPLFRRFRDHLAPDCEITLEANPESVTPERLAAWRALGFNRISLGVQTFEDEGLRILTRQHGRAGALAALRASVEQFPKVNVDIIYGWPGQNVAALQRDLEQVVLSGVGHASLYILTLEGQTPMHLAAKRGVLKDVDETLLHELYQAACGQLGSAGFRHEEVSNWAKPGQTCEHNWFYWLGEPYVGIRAGAHGFLRLPPSKHSEHPFGLRYAYPRSDRVFTGQVASRDVPAPVEFGGETFAVEVDDGRDADAWLLEFVASSLRTERGVDLEHIQKITGRRLAKADLFSGPDAALCRASLRGDNRRLFLDRKEWLREGAWVRRVVDAVR